MTEQRLHGYVVDRELGVGGHAVVYLARDPDSGREVVIKRMHDHLPRLDPGLIRRFGREAEILRTIRHPNIVRVLDFSSDEQAGVSLIMEHLPGGTLDERLRREDRPTQARVVDIGVQLMGALEHAWQQGVLHRDIKPSNVLFDAEGNPVLCDFGVAKVDTSTTLTGTGETIGTPAYMSPEQVQGREMDCRSDLYSLALVLFEMLEGYLPFRKADAVATSLARILEQPPALSPANAAFQRFMHRALATDPAQRFDGFGPAIDALAQCLLEGQADPTLPTPALRVQESDGRFEIDFELPVHSTRELGSGVHQKIDLLLSPIGQASPGLEAAARDAADREPEWSEPFAIRPSFLSKLELHVDRLHHQNLALFMRLADDAVILPKTRFVTYGEGGKAIIHLQVNARVESLSMVGYSPEQDLGEVVRRPVKVVGIRRLMQTE